MPELFYITRISTARPRAGTKKRLAQQSHTHSTFVLTFHTAPFSAAVRSMCRWAGPRAYGRYNLVPAKVHSLTTLDRTSGRCTSRQLRRGRCHMHSSRPRSRILTCSAEYDPLSSAVYLHTYSRLYPPQAATKHVLIDSRKSRTAH